MAGCITRLGNDMVSDQSDELNLCTPREIVLQVANSLATTEDVQSLSTLMLLCSAMSRLESRPPCNSDAVRKPSFEIAGQFRTRSN